MVKSYSAHIKARGTSCNCTPGPCRDTRIHPKLFLFQDGLQSPRWMRLSGQCLSLEDKFGFLSSPVWTTRYLQSNWEALSVYEWQSGSEYRGEGGRLLLQVGFWVVPRGLWEQWVDAYQNMWFHKILCIKPGLLLLFCKLAWCYKSRGSCAWMLEEVSIDNSYPASFWQVVMKQPQLQKTSNCHWK